MCGSSLRRGNSLSNSKRLLKRIRLSVLFNTAISERLMCSTTDRQNLASIFRPFYQCRSDQWRFHLRMSTLFPENIVFSPPIGNVQSNI